MFPKNHRFISYLFPEEILSVNYVNVLLKIFLAQGANVNAKDRGGNTALHWAVKSTQNDRLLALLVKNGALVNEKNARGESPLHVAARFDQQNIVERVKQHLRAGF